MTTPQAVLDCLTKLGAVLIDHRLSEAQIISRNAGYIEKLQALDYRDLKAACDRAATSLEHFPTIAKLMDFAKANAELRDAQEAAERRRMADQSVLSAEIRNEAILLVGAFSHQVRTLLTPPECRSDDAQRQVDRDVQNFWAEAARLWARVRPAGGLPEVDRNRQRNRYGFALEAWARSYLGAPPLARGFATEPMLQIYRSMTAEEPELGDDAAEPGIPGGVTRHLRIVDGGGDAAVRRHGDDAVRESARRINAAMGGGR